MTRLFKSVVLGVSLGMVIGVAPQAFGRVAGKSSLNRLTAQEIKEGWVRLFDGVSTNGWHTFNAAGINSRWHVEQGELALEPSPTRKISGADLESHARFADFELSLEWKMSRGGNSGIFYRVQGEGYAHPWDIALEYQLLDNHVEGGPPLHQAGAVWDLYAPARDVTRPIGQFNQARIIVRCGWVEHWMNGVKLLRFQLGSADFKQRHAVSANRKNSVYGMAERGTIVLQDEGRQVSFRNIKIRPLTEACEGSARVPTYIDADTANEIDDGFAILRALRAPELQVMGLSSIGWPNSMHIRGPDFAGATHRSQAANEDILALEGKLDEISHPLGALSPMLVPERPIDSAAARDIIAKSYQVPLGSRLRVYVLGAFTNVASALLIDPSLKERIDIYVIGYNFKDGTLDATDFNSEGDRAASAFLLKSGASLYIMPANQLGPFKFDRNRFEQAAQGRLERWLLHRWQDFFHVLQDWAPAIQGDDRYWVMWDVALVEISLRTELAQIKMPAQMPDTIRVFVDPDLSRMHEDFYSAIKGVAQ